jgi:hypothetical protein
MVHYLRNQWMKTIIFIFASVSLCSISRAGIDFKAGTDERTLEGIKFQQLVFRDNTRRVTYEQPRGWSYLADTGRVRFTPPGVTQAQAEIDQLPLAAPMVFDEATTKKLQEQFLAGLPPGSQDAKVELEEKSPLKKNDYDTYGVTVSYRLYGQEFSTSVLYLSLPDTLVRFRATARKVDFEKIHRAFRGSVFSWQWRAPTSPMVAKQER